MFDKGSVSIRRVVEDLLVRENIMLSARAERFAQKIDDVLAQDNSWVQLYNGTTYTRYDNPRASGIGRSIPATVREHLVAEGIVSYKVAERFSEAVDRRLYGHNPLRLSDGTALYLAYEVWPKKSGQVQSFVPALRGAPLRVDGKLVKRAVKARLSR